METSDLGSETEASDPYSEKKKMSKKKSKTEASDLHSEKKKMKKKSKMEASDVDSEKKKKKNKKKKSKAEASDLDSEKKKMKKKMKKEMRMTKASDLESEKNKKMKKSKNKNMSLAIEEYEPETDPVETKTSLESSSVHLEAEKAKMSLEKKTSHEEEEKKATPDEKETNPVEKEPNPSSYTSEDEDEELTESDISEYKEYCKKLVSSGGFDIDRCPPLFQCVHCPVKNLKEGDKRHLKLCRFSTIAIDQYNLDNSKDYQFAKFEKAVSAPCAGTKYYITFEAREPSSSDDAPTTTFQALVYEGIPDRSGPEIIEEIKVMLVRMKSQATTKDNDILLG